MRQFALGLLILIAVPTIARGDAADELECQMLMIRGRECVEWAWTKYTNYPNGVVKRGSLSECEADLGYKNPSGGLRRIPGCKCNRQAYQDFGLLERIKYHRCK